MRLILVGPPGAGKGTQAKLLSALIKRPHISTGEMLRAASQSSTDFGRSVKEVIDSGKLVSDELMIEIVKKRLSESDCSNGYILDGFPRTLAQASSLDSMLSELGQELDGVLFFEISEEELFNRLEARRQIEARADDGVDTQKARIKVYSEQTAPLIEFYKKKKLLLTIPSNGSVEQVQVAVSAAVAGLSS